MFRGADSFMLQRKLTQRRASEPMVQGRDHIPARSGLQKTLREGNELVSFSRARSLEAHECQVGIRTH
jgi:hypothetical protein